MRVVVAVDAVGVDVERTVDDRLGAGEAERLDVALVIVEVEVDVGVVKGVVAALGGPDAVGGGARRSGRRFDVLDVDVRTGQLVHAAGDGQVAQRLGRVRGIEGRRGRGVGQRIGIERGAWIRIEHIAGAVDARGQPWRSPVPLIDRRAWLCIAPSVALLRSSGRPAALARGRCCARRPCWCAAARSNTNRAGCRHGR